MKWKTLAIAFLLLIPASCSALTAELSGADDENLFLIINSPYDGEEIWIDVVPPQIAIIGEAYAPSGIREITIRNDLEEISCGSDTNFACSVNVSAGQSLIAVKVEDNLGNSIEKNLNLTVHIGLPPPSLLSISGKVTDGDGRPVKAALVVFESAIGMTSDNTPLSVSNLTGEDGFYLVEGAVGYQQTVIIQKDGYIPVEREVFFENMTNQLNLELEPQSQDSPGFGFLTGLVGLLGALIFVRRRES